MNPERLHALAVTRRHFLEEAGFGVGKIALATLLGEAMVGGDLHALRPRRQQSRRTR